MEKMVQKVITKEIVKEVPVPNIIEKVIKAYLLRTTVEKLSGITVRGLAESHYYQVRLEMGNNDESTAAVSAKVADQPSSPASQGFVWAEALFNQTCNIRVRTDGKDRYLLITVTDHHDGQIQVVGTGRLDVGRLRLAKDACTANIMLFGTEQQHVGDLQVTFDVERGQIEEHRPSSLPGGQIMRGLRKLGVTLLRSTFSLPPGCKLVQVRLSLGHARSSTSPHTLLSGIVDWNQTFSFDVATRPSMRFGGSVLATQDLNVQLCDASGRRTLARGSIPLCTLARNQIQTINLSLGDSDLSLIVCPQDFGVPTQPYKLSRMNIAVVKASVAPGLLRQV